MQKKDLVVFCPVNPLRAYGGVKYLCDGLARRGIRLDVWANIPWAIRHETQGWSYPVHCGWWYAALPGKLFKIQMWLARLHIFLVGLFTDTPILFVELWYLREIFLLKKLRPNRIFIHYCPELFTEQDPIHRTLKDLVRFYKHVADFPDIIIDVEPNRAALRKEWYHLSKEPFVVLNTIPQSEVPTQSAEGYLSKLAGANLPKDRPILLYVGGVQRDREMGLLVEALAQMSQKPFLLAFCYGDDTEIQYFQQRCKEQLGERNARICGSVPRKLLLSCMNEATAGFMYYRPSQGIGYLYAAPTKLFEYIAVGLPVITSSNPGIVELVQKHGLGVSVSDESVGALSTAIDQLLFKCNSLDEIRKREQEEFSFHLCYEIVSKRAIDAIVEILHSDKQTKKEQ